MKRTDHLNKHHLGLSSTIHTKVKAGFHLTQKTDKEAVPFKLLHGRDNLYQRMHGLPKETKEEIKKKKDKYKDNVDYREFLPNSISKSP